MNVPSLVLKSILATTVMCFLLLLFFCIHVCWHGSASQPSLYLNLHYKTATSLKVCLSSASESMTQHFLKNSLHVKFMDKVAKSVYLKGEKGGCHGLARCLRSVLGGGSVSFGQTPRRSTTAALKLVMEMQISMP